MHVTFRCFEAFNRDRSHLMHIFYTSSFTICLCVSMYKCVLLWCFFIKIFLFYADFPLKYFPRIDLCGIVGLLLWSRSYSVFSYLTYNFPFLDAIACIHLTLFDRKRLKELLQSFNRMCIWLRNPFFIVKFKCRSIEMLIRIRLS